MLRHAAYLPGRLAGEATEQATLAGLLVRDDAALTTAMSADLVLGPARNVLILWADLFGLREVYNWPGVIDWANWRLRVPADFERAYGDACDRCDAPDLPRALTRALRARRLHQDAESAALVAARDKQAAADSSDGCGRGPR